jgi:hypothetical protein
MFGGFDLSDFNKTISDLTANIPVNITLSDILEAGGDSSADASTTLFFNPTVEADSSKPIVNGVDDKLEVKRGSIKVKI